MFNNKNLLKVLKAAERLIVQFKDDYFYISNGFVGFRLDYSFHDIINLLFNAGVIKNYKTWEIEKGCEFDFESKGTFAIDNPAKAWVSPYFKQAPYVSGRLGMVRLVECDDSYTAFNSKYISTFDESSCKFMLSQDKFKLFVLDQDNNVIGLVMAVRECDLPIPRTPVKEQTAC